MRIRFKGSLWNNLAQSIRAILRSRSHRGGSGIRCSPFNPYTRGSLDLMAGLEGLSERERHVRVQLRLTDIFGQRSFHFETVRGLVAAGINSADKLQGVEFLPGISTVQMRHVLEWYRSLEAKFGDEWDCAERLAHDPIKWYCNPNAAYLAVWRP